MWLDEQWISIMVAAVEFVDGHDRPDINPSLLLAAVNRKVPVSADDLKTAAMRCKQLGAHLHRAAYLAEVVEAERASAASVES